MPGDKIGKELTRICPMCGDEFPNRPHWGWYYSAGSHKAYVCSYSCKRYYETKVQKQKKKKKDIEY